jgi:2-keto-4-pentenoate hydratase
MTRDDVEHRTLSAATTATAASLVEARHGRSLVTPPSRHCDGFTIEARYTVGNQVAALWRADGRTSPGLKIGLTARPVKRRSSSI